MKEKELIHIYESPEIEVIVFDDNDHIMTSNQSGAFDWLEYES